MPYFSDREGGPRPRTETAISGDAWGGIVALVSTAVTSGGLAQAFPEVCPDGSAIYGTDRQALELAIRSEIPGLQWPLRAEVVPSLPVAMDIIEFVHASIAQAEPFQHHQYYGHSHLSFSRESGQGEMRIRVNRIFQRNGLRYQMSEEGEVQQLVPAALAGLVTSDYPPSGDEKLDSLLREAVERFTNRSPSARREALGLLWKAWERLKSLSEPADKRRSTQLMLSAAAREPEFRKLLEEEALELTRIGNTFHIRHSEVAQTEIEEDAQLEYLFYRLAALIMLVLMARR